MLHFSPSFMCHPTSAFSFSFLFHCLSLVFFSSRFVHHWHPITKTIFAYGMERPSLSFLSCFYIFNACKFLVSITMDANILGVDSISPSRLVFWCIVLSLDYRSAQIGLPAKQNWFLSLSSPSTDSVSISPFL